MMYVSKDGDGATTRDQGGHPGEPRMTMRSESCLQLQHGLKSCTTTGEILSGVGSELELDFDSSSVSFLSTNMGGKEEQCEWPYAPPLPDSTTTDISVLNDTENKGVKRSFKRQAIELDSSWELAT